MMIDHGVPPLTQRGEEIVARIMLDVLMHEAHRYRLLNWGEQSNDDLWDLIEQAEQLVHKDEHSRGHLQAMMESARKIASGRTKRLYEELLQLRWYAWEEARTHYSVKELVVEFPERG